MDGTNFKLVLGVWDGGLTVWAGTPNGHIRAWRYSNKSNHG